MNAITKSNETKDRKVVLSTLWIFAVINYLYADVFTLFFTPNSQSSTLAMPQMFVLVVAILMETSMAMIFLSRFLNYRINRLVNIIFGIFHTLFVTWSMIGSPLTPFYTFFAAVEIITTLFITWYAWNWKNPVAQVESKSVLAI